MNPRFLCNVILKGLVLFILFDLVFATVDPAALGKLSLYNHLFSGRLRLPYGEDSSQSYNLSLFNLDAMFASHVIADGQKRADEYRVIIVGDSSIWGTLLHPEETLAGQLDAAGLSLCGKKVRVYNLGYPTISLMKDLMMLDYAHRYHPDLIIWVVTLEAFPVDKQFSSPILSNNFDRVKELIDRFNLPIDLYAPSFEIHDIWDRTLIGQRRTLADLFRLQMYGVLWTSTGIDQVYPSKYQQAKTDFSTDTSYQNMQPPTLEPTQLAFDVLEAGLGINEMTPVLLVNEPILVSVGKNSDLRYNFFYPRWAYDQWREMMSIRAKAEGWNYLDLWNIVPAEEFTNSAIHLTPTGESIMAKWVGESAIQQNCP